MQEEDGSQRRRLTSKEVEVESANGASSDIIAEGTQDNVKSDEQKTSADALDDNSLSVEWDNLDDNTMGITEDDTKRDEAPDTEGRPETVAAASTTAVYQAQYARVTTDNSISRWVLKLQE